MDLGKHFLIFILIHTYCVINYTVYYIGFNI